MASYQANPDRWLIISDLQIPFEHEKAHEFCSYLLKQFRIPIENVYCVGDETDQYWGGMWEKDINAHHTALSEITETKERMAPWFETFPILKICESNHGTRWKRKALESQILSIMMRRYEEVLGCPPTWCWAKYWKVPAPHPFMVEHGDDYGGAHPATVAAMHNGMSTVIGHHHSKATIEHIQTNGQRIWGAVSGSLIDFRAYAFNYARSAKLKPLIGTTVVLEGGKMPIWIPLT